MARMYLQEGIRGSNEAARPELGGTIQDISENPEALMGGLGSGRQGGRETTESRRPLDIGRLRRAGVLTDGWRGGWEWSCNGEKVSSIGIEGGSRAITLRYRSRRYDQDWQDVVERIPIVWRTCRFGGQRPYFVCPGVVDCIPCGRTVTKLYSVGKYYLCRHCGRLTYASRSEGSCDRALRRANRIKQRLGGEPGLAASVPPRPKGMWANTYARLVQQIDQSEKRAEQRLVLVAARLLARAQKPRSRARRAFWR